MTDDVADAVIATWEAHEDRQSPVLVLVVYDDISKIDAQDKEAAVLATLGGPQRATQDRTAGAASGHGGAVTQRLKNKMPAHQHNRLIQMANERYGARLLLRAHRIFHEAREQPTRKGAYKIEVMGADYNR